VEPIGVNEPAELDPAFATVTQSRPDALIVHPTPVSVRHVREIAEFAIKERLPTFSWSEGNVRQGLRMGYAADWTKVMTRAAAVTGKILRGAKPADIPVEQPTKFNLVINLKTARAIGIEIPSSILGRADEIIE
jgi:putative ABC transport system substrate-binding protein